MGMVRVAIGFAPHYYNQCFCIRHGCYNAIFADQIWEDIGKVSYLRAGLIPEWVLLPDSILVREKEALQHAAPGGIFFDASLGEVFDIFLLSASLGCESR